MLHAVSRTGWVAEPLLLPAATRAQEPATRAALHGALALYAQPAQAVALRRGALPAADFSLLLRCAAGAPELTETAALLRVPAPQLQAALDFYLEQLLFAPGAPASRLLALPATATAADARRNAALIGAWLRNGRRDAALTALRLRQLQQALHAHAHATLPAKPALRPASLRLRLHLRWLGAGLLVLPGLLVLAAVTVWPGRPLPHTDTRRVTTAADAPLPPAIVLQLAPAPAPPPRAAALDVPAVALALPLRSLPALPIVAPQAKPVFAAVVTAPALTHGPAVAESWPLPPARRAAALPAQRAPWSLPRSTPDLALSRPALPVPATLLAAAPAAHAAAPDNAAAIASLLDAFRTEYAGGDITRFMRLFRADVHADGQDYAALRASYVRLFAATRARRVALEDVRVLQHTPDATTLRLHYHATVLALDAAQPAHYRGALILHLRRDTSGWRIAALQRAAQPTALSAR